MVRVVLGISLAINCVLAVILFQNKEVVFSGQQTGSMPVAADSPPTTSLTGNRNQDESQAKVEKVDFSGAQEISVNYSKDSIDEHLKNLPKVLKDAKAVPFVEPGSGGKITGFKVVSVRPNSIYTEMGIKRGDIIRGVNGDAVDSPQRAMQMYQSLKQGQLLNIQIVRDGQRRIINYFAE